MIFQLLELIWRIDRPSRRRNVIDLLLSAWCVLSAVVWTEIYFAKRRG